MVSAFSEICNNVRLIAAGFFWTRGKKNISLAEWYGVKTVPNILRIPERLFGVFPFESARNRKIFFCLCFLYFLFKRNCIIYTREEKLLKWSKWLKIPMLFEVHLKPTFTHQELNKYVRENSFLRGVVSISPFLANVYAQYLPSSKILHCEDGVRLEDYEGLPNKLELRAKLGIQMGVFSKLAVFTGHLYPDRGIETIMEVAPRFSDVLFLLVGGWETDVKNRREEVKTRKIKNIQFHGFRPHVEIPMYQGAADVLILPYSAQLNIGEYFSSLKLFEYMASGTPIVASNLPRISEVLTGDAGVLCPPDSAISLENGIRKVFADYDLALQRSERARLLARKYSWGVRAKSIKEAFL